MTEQPKSSSPPPKWCEFDEPILNDAGRKQFTCKRCRRPTVWLPQSSKRVLRICDRQGEGWGDKVARLLSYVGITQPRIVAMFGDCNCPERQQKLNQVGWELADRWKGLFRRLRA